MKLYATVEVQLHLNFDHGWGLGGHNNLSIEALQEIQNTLPLPEIEQRFLGSLVVSYMSYRLIRPSFFCQFQNLQYPPTPLPYLAVPRNSSPFTITQTPHHISRKSKWNVTSVLSLGSNFQPSLYRVFHKQSQLLAKQNQCNTELKQFSAFPKNVTGLTEEFYAVDILITRYTHHGAHDNRPNNTLMPTDQCARQ